MGRQGGEGRGKRREPSTIARRPKVQKGQATTVSGLCREEPLQEGQPNPWVGEFGVGNQGWGGSGVGVRLYQPYPVTSRD